MNRFSRLALVAGILATSILTGLAVAPAAHAANKNPWKAADVRLDVDRAPDVDCRISSRYTETGEGVEWTDTLCQGSNASGIPDAGHDFTLRFMGARAGEPLEEAPYQQTHDLATLTEWSAAASGGLTAGSQSFWIAGKNLTGESRTINVAYWCINTDTFEAASGGGSSARGPAAPGGTAAWGSSATPRTCTGTNVALGGWSICDGPGSNDAGAPGCDRFVIQYATTGGSGGSPGEGEGNPCSATATGQFVASGEGSFWAPAATIPAGAVTFPNEVGGFCIVTEVCIELDDEHWGFDTHGEGCSAFSLGSPVEAPGAPDVPATDAPPTLPADDAPEAADEESFWNNALDGLLGIIRAIGRIPGMILDGLVGLFVPSQGALDGFTDDVRDAWSGGKAGDWKDALAGAVPDAGSSPGQIVSYGNGKAGIEAGSGCAGPGIRWHLLEEAGVGDGGVFYPLKACDGVLGQAADWTRLFLSAVLGATGLFKIVQILMTSLGATKPGQNVGVSA